MIRCRSARRLIDAALEHELPLERRLELETHIARCPACALRACQARTLQEWLEGPGDPPPSPPDVEAALHAVFARLGSDECRPPRPRRARRVALLAGLVVAAGLLLALALRRGVTTERVESGPPLAGAFPAHEEGMDGAELEIGALVRAALLDCFAGRGLDVERAHGRYLAAVREPLRAGWPVRRFVERELASPETSLALAAVRCLGVGGEASAALALERALVRAELAAEALEALGNLALSPAAEEPAMAALARALDVPALAPTALRELCRVGGERAAAIIERAACSTRAGGALSREAVLDALTATGPAAVASLLRLAGDAPGEDEATAILVRLPLVAGAGPELAGLLAQGSVASALAYPALAALQPPEAVPWLEERALESRERAQALETLAGFRGSEPLAAVLRLAQAERVPRAAVLELLVRLLEGDEGRAEAFTRGLVARAGAGPLCAWLALLIESEHPGAAPALVALVFAPALPREEREWAALAVGELGAAHEARALALALEERLDGDARLGAACLVSIHAHLGAEGVAAVLAHASLSGRRRVLAALEGGGSAGGAVRVHRVARAFEDALARPSATVALKEIP